jgi:hypothetical protein
LIVRVGGSITYDENGNGPISGIIQDNTYMPFYVANQPGYILNGSSSQYLPYIHINDSKNVTRFTYVYCIKYTW